MARCRRCRAPTRRGAACSRPRRRIPSGAAARRRCVHLLRCPATMDDGVVRQASTRNSLLTVRADEDPAGGHQPSLRPPRRCRAPTSSWRSCATGQIDALPAAAPRLRTAWAAAVEIRGRAQAMPRRGEPGRRPARAVRAALLANSKRGLVAQAAAVDAPYAKLEQLEPGIARVLAHNPSAFTYYGTQTYLVGESEVAVIDPGPDLPEHLDALEQAIAGRPVAAIMCTHTHRDHSPAARPLAERDRRADHRLRAAGAGDGRPARRCRVRRRLCRRTACSRTARRRDRRQGRRRGRDARPHLEPSLLRL